MNNKLPPLLQGVKVSETFMHYVEPFLNQFVSDKAKHGIFDINLEELDRILKLPWCIWNAVAAESSPTNEIDFLSWLNILTQNAPVSIKNLLNFMEIRKRNQFHDYKYLFGEYKLYYNQNNELRISVEARTIT